MFWRIMQAFGAGGGWAIGGAVIGDIFRLEERGKALGIFSAVRTMSLANVQLLICTLH